jgi:single-strand DNA-binding protein
MINKTILIGNCGKDPEVRTTTNSKVASFSLATSESHKNQAGEKITETEWHSLKCWGKLADIAEKYIKKGQQLYVEGKIHYGNYDNKEGVKVYTTDIIVTTLQMIGKKEAGQSESKQPETREDILNQPDDNKNLPF